MSPACSAAIFTLISGMMRSSTPSSLGIAGFEVIWVAGHHHSIARGVADEFERAGADRLGREQVQALRGVIFTWRSHMRSASALYGEFRSNTTVAASGADTAATMSYWLRDGQRSLDPAGGGTSRRHRRPPSPVRRGFHAAAQAERPVLQVFGG